jgi:hypothetical protein
MPYARRTSALSALFVSSTLLLGCIDENEAVIFVDPSVPSVPSANITGSVLGSTIEGSFQLRLVLGPRASGPSTVTLDSVVIKDASEQAAIGPVLAVVSSKPFPLTVQPDSDVTIDATFDLGSGTVDMATTTKLCDPAGIRISGAIGDTLAAGATPFVSDTFKPSGCP